MSIFKQNIETPLGTLVACATEENLCLLQFSDNKKLDAILKNISKHLQMEMVEKENALLKKLEIQLHEYFNGERKVFSIPLLLIGTDFQKSVWNVLQDIPYGKTISYQKQSTLLHNPKAVRAVANANGQNKIAILIPCHRVIGSNGSLTGYATGIWRKEKLLNLEQVAESNRQLAKSQKK